MRCRGRKFIMAKLSATRIRNLPYLQPSFKLVSIDPRWEKIISISAEDSEDLTSIIGFDPKLQHPRNYWSEMRPKSLLLGLSSKKRITFGSHLTDKKFSPFIEYTQTTNTGAGAKSMKL